MSQPLHILHLEDNPRDAELVQALLASDGLACVFQTVQSREAFAEALARKRFDLIISDFSLPSYDGRSALLFAREQHPGIPYIFFSGTIGEDAAIDALRDGATDYVLKQRPARLVSSVRRALNEATERAERKIAACRQAAQYAVTAVLSESSTLTDAAPRILRAICESLDWNVGGLWFVDDTTTVLRFVALWHAEKTPVPAFEAQSRRMTFAPGNGMPGRVWASGQPVWIADVTAAPNFPRAPIAVQEGLRAAFGFPIIDGNTIIGVIEFFSHEIREPDQALLQMLGAIGSQIGQFAARTRAHQELEEQLRMKTFTAEIGAAITLSTTTETGLRLCAQSIVDYFDAAFARIWILDPHRNELVLQASAGLYTNLEGAYHRVPVGQYKIGLIAQERKPALTNCVVGDPHIHDQEWAKREGMVAFAGYPLLVEERVVGVMAMFARKPLSEVVLQAMQTVAHGMAQFIDRKQAEAELRKTEEQLRQAQKLEGIGQLAGGIAHDFNNLLTVINGYSDLILKILPSNHPICDHVKQIREAGHRSASLTQQILAFSRQQALNPIVFNLNEAVAKMEKLLNRLLGEHIALTTSPDPGLGWIKADQGQIEQVIVNLAVNARDAMPDGGHLTIETRNVFVDDSLVRAHPSMQPGPYVKLVVRDTGCGMDAATQSRIFEPFFTTKGRDKGTGLGLATVYGIVTQSEGAIVVQSEVGNGSTFSVYLPRTQDGIESTVQPQASLDSPKGSETILLVEDEDMVRSLTRQVLRELGYAVLDARQGAKAQEICEKYARPIHLLLTDVVMPGINGRELAERLLTIRPEMKVLYMSGYENKVLGQQGTLPVGTAFLPKPFSADSLARKVREALDKKTVPPTAH